MIFRKATQEDLDYVRANPFEGSVKDYPYFECPEDNTITTIFEGSIVAVGGVRVLWEGVGLFWLILTDDCKKKGCFGITALYAIKGNVEKLIKNNNLWRAQATVRTDFPKAIEMMRFLGFKNETPDGMKNYFPDKGDAYMYARII